MWWLCLWKQLRQIKLQLSEKAANEKARAAERDQYGYGYDDDGYKENKDEYGEYDDEDDYGKSRRKDLLSWKALGLATGSTLVKKNQITNNPCKWFDLIYFMFTYIFYIIYLNKFLFEIIFF